MQRASTTNKVFRFFWIGATVVAAVGCATRPKEDSSEVADLKRQLIELQRTFANQSLQITELNNKILLLKDKIDVHSESNAPAEVPLPVNGAALQATLPPQRESEKPESSSAEKLFSQVVLDAKRSQLTSLEHDVDSMLKNYKESPLTNNALFLLAETHFERGQYAQGASQFEKLYKTFPDGNKAVAALYRLGLCYEKMGHANEAKEAFQNVIAVYPGSAEALDSEKRLKGQGAKTK